MIQHKPAHGLALGSLQFSLACDMCSVWQTPSTLPHTLNSTDQGKFNQSYTAACSRFPFSNQISLAGHSSAVLPLAMPFYFNGTSFVRLTRKASVSCSEPAGHESSPNWERAGILRGAQNLSWQPWARGVCTAPICVRNLLCLHGHHLRNIYDSSKTQM